MAQIELWTGLPGSGRTREALALASGSVREGRGVWWITDTQRQAEKVESKLLDYLGGSYAGVEIGVIGRLPMHLLQASGRTINTVATEVREIVLRELVDEAATKREIPVESSEGWTRRMAEFYLRLQNGDSALEKNLRVHYPWARKIINAYTERLAEAGLIDESDLPAVAGELIASASFQTPSLLVVDRLGPLLAPEMDLLLSLARASARVVVLLDDLEGGGPSLQLSKDQKEKWLSLPEVAEHAFACDPVRERLARNLFVKVSGAANDSMDVGGDVCFAHHTDRASEVRAAARLIAERVHDDGLDPSTVAVICTRLEDYEAHIREMFPRYGLLPDIRLGPRLDTNPIAKVTLSLFDLRSRGLSRERVTDLLLGPYVRWKRMLAQKENVLSFDSAARSARIRDGGDFDDAWRAPLEDELRRRSELADALEEEGEEEETSSMARVRRIRREIESTRRALAELAELNSRLLELPDPCTVDEATEWLESLLRKLGVIDAANRTARRDPQLGGDDVRALGHLKLTLQHVATSFTFHQRERWPVERFAETLRFALRTARLRPSNRLRGGVAVAGPLELRGMECEELILLGMTAEAWPRSPELDLADPFGTRWAMIDRLAESRALTFEALLAAKRVTFSSPTPRKGEGKEAPSPLLEEIRAAGVKISENGLNIDVLRSPLEVLPRAGQLFDWDCEAESDDLLKAVSERSQRVNLRGASLALRVEKSRQDPGTLTRYEGFLADGPLADRVSQRILSRPLSATRLDSYAKCPMQFFLGHALEISPLEEVEDDIDARQLGGAVHDILARTVEELRHRRGEDPDLSENVGEVAEVMQGVAETILNRTLLDNLYGDATRRMLLSGLTNSSEPAGRLWYMLEKNTKELAGDRVHMVEAAFGLPVETGQSTLLEQPIRIEKDGVTVELVGRIDRVDLHPEKGWRIFDYKLSSSTQPSADKINMGLSFQLPLYAWALEDWLSREPDTHEFDIARYFQIKSASSTLSTGWKKKNHDESSENLKRRVLDIFKAIENGRYHHPLNEDEKLCNPNLEFNYCPFKYVCRRDHALFAQRPEKLKGEYLKNAYRLSFQQFANNTEGVDHA